MLRRPPTLITLTGDDIAAYEDARLARLQARMAAAGKENDAVHNAVHNADGQSTSPEARQPPPPDPSDELKPFPGERTRVTRYVPGQNSASASAASVSGSAAAAASAVATPSGPSNAAAGTMGSPQAPTRTRDQRIGLTR